MSRTHFRTALANAVMASAIVTSMAAAARAEEGPIVLGRTEHPPTFTLDPWQVSASLQAIVQYDSVKSGGSTTSSSSELVQETLSVATGGGIVSKSFFDWSAGATVGLEENWEQHSSGGPGGTGNSSSLGFVDTYNLQANMLRATDFPATVYARRTENYTALSFQPLLKTTVNDYGATFSYRNPDHPTTLNLYHTDTEQSQLNGQPTLKLGEDHLEFQTAWDPNDRNHLDLTYEYVSVDQQNPGSLLQNYETQNLTANHAWQIDSGGKYVLNQSLNYNTQTGDFPFEHFRLNEQLRLRHSDEFETNYNYAFDQQNFNTSDSQSHQLSAGFTHHLYQSLTTTGQIGGSTTTRDVFASGATPGSNSSTDTYFGNLALNYTKHIPYGILGANFSIGYNQTNNSATGFTQQVNNQLETFNDPQPIVLTTPNINPGTLQVFNASHTRQFVEGIDYTVSSVGNTVHIDRIPFTSNIAPNETVLLNYNIDPLPAYTLTSTLISSGVRYDFTEGILKRLGVYVQYTQQNQTSTSLQIHPDDINDLTYGADYRVWKLSFHAEREDHQSTLNPFNSTRFFASYSDRITPRTGFTLAAAQSWNEYPLTNSTANLTTVDFHLDYQISRELRAIFFARWRDNQDSSSGNSMGFEEQGELRWNVRQTQMYLLIRHDSVFSSGSDSLGITTQFGITRQF